MATQLKQRPLVSVLYGENLENSSHFQPYSHTPVEYEGNTFYFLDVDIDDTNRRQAQYTSMPQSLKIRTNPETSQEGSSIPGVGTTYDDLEIVKILQALKNHDGLRDAIVEIIRIYVDQDDNHVRTRYGVYQIVSSKVMDDGVKFVLSSDITPVAPLVPEIRRVS